jgi:hypothetical protein
MKNIPTVRLSPDMNLKQIVDEIQINVNELDHFMIKLNVKELNLEEIYKFYIKSLEFFYYSSIYSMIIFIFL